MLILTLRTDNPQAEIGLYDNDDRLTYDTWHAHRDLGRTIHDRIKHLVASQGFNIDDIEGVVAFRGPGSFTGLRIGLTVADAMAYGNGSPIVGSMGETWIADGIARLKSGENDVQVVPEYGSEAHITTPRK